MPTFTEVIIWNNSNIKVDGKTVYYRSWHYKGVTKLIDLLDDQKSFLSFGAFTQKYKVKPNACFGPTKDNNLSARAAKTKPGPQLV